MNVPLRFKDEVKILSTRRNEYGDIQQDSEYLTKGLFLQGTSESFQNDTYTVGVDSHIYLDPLDEVVAAEAFHLEGKLISVKAADGVWDDYKIQRVKIGQRKLLNNQINNIHCFLSRVDRS